MTPDEYTNQELMLDVGDGHTLYVHDWGNKKATQPIVFLHGGPGGGCSDRHKQRFDPTIHRVIFHDQRGSGRSTPYGELAHNTTENLVEDIEKIAQKLKLTSFVLTGGSWGSCLALAYAIKHPKRVSKLILTGIFAGTQTEIDWVDKGYFELFFPDVQQRFVEATPKTYQKDPMSYHAKHLFGKDPAKVTASAQAINNLQSAIMSLDDRHSPVGGDDYDPVPTQLETHYMQNACFLPDNYIMKHVSKITVPTWIVQGRYDMVCPPATAYELHQRIKGSRLIWTMAGHGNDRSTYDVMRTIFLQNPTS